MQLENLYIPVLPAAVVGKEDSFGQSCANLLVMALYQIKHFCILNQCTHQTKNLESVLFSQCKRTLFIATVENI